MPNTLNYTEQLVVEHCCNCGVAFAMPTDFEQRRRQDRKTFYCPAGHGQHYIGKTEAEKLEEKLEAERRRSARLLAQADQARADAEHQAAKARGYKGAMTQAKKRSAKGVCPVPGCRRHFVNVQRHVQTQHPEFSLTDDDV